MAVGTAVAVVVMVVFRGGDGLPVPEEGEEESLDQRDTGPAPGPGVLGLVGGPPPVRSCPPGPGVLGLLAGPPPVRGCCTPGPGVLGLLAGVPPVRGCPPVGDGFREERAEVFEFGPGLFLRNK
jgi:hypothetical protein